MTAAGAREHGFRVATFDCYGTLVDWEGGAASFLYQLAAREGDPDPGPGQVLRDRWEALQFELLAGPYRPYRSILAASLEAWCRERGYACQAADGEALVAAMGSWQPFPDTRPALLQAHAAGLRLVIVSNTDRAIIERTLRQLDLPFDDVIVAEDCEAYKPSNAVFDYVLDRLGEAARDHPPRGVRLQVRHRPGGAPRDGHRLGQPARRTDPARRTTGLRLARPVGPRRTHGWRRAGALTARGRVGRLPHGQARSCSRGKQQTS